MLKIEIPSAELYDEDREEFITVKKTTLRLEHSLVSVSKWESTWKKPFLDGKNKKTPEETIDYIRCMTLDQNVDPNVYLAIPSSEIEKINAYISDEKTATWFNEPNKSPSHEIVTSELIYYWMTAYQIPFECQKWHLSRLMALIRICNIKNAPDKKMSKSSILAKNKQINAARRKAMHTKG